MDEDYAKERQELVSRFRQAIKGQLPDAWFDEDDLLDIFDYAGDTGDDYVRAEVLMWGARYFPDSERLRERRGVFYADVLTDDAVANFAADTTDPDSLLTRILALRSERLSRADARLKIKQIFEENTNIDDEPTIQLVTLADETSNLDWIIENLDFCLSRVGYKPALLYEVAAFARDHEDWDNCINMLKRLVDEMPYNADYWSLLASAYESTGNDEAAAEAHDMTLAIDPKNQEAIAAKALYFSTNNKFDELYKLYLENPDNERVSQHLIDAMWYAKHPQAVEFFDRHVQRFGVKDHLVTMCAMQMPEHVNFIAEYYFGENCTDDNLNDVRIWTKWCESLASAGAIQGATAMMEILFEHQSQINTYHAQAVCTLIELYFVAGRWQKVIDTTQKYRLSDVINNLATTYMLIVSYMKTGDTNKADVTMRERLPYLISDFINDIPIWRIEQHLVRKSIVSEMQYLETILNDPEAIAAYKPLGLLY